jgi:hypothetical protein
VKAYPTAAEVIDSLAVGRVSVAPGPSLDGHDLAVESLRDGVSDSMGQKVIMLSSLLASIRATACAGSRRLRIVQVTGLDFLCHSK